MMPAALLVKQMEAEGLFLNLDREGRIALFGDRDAVNRWLPSVQAYRGDIIRVLVVQDFIGDVAERSALISCDGTDSVLAALLDMASHYVPADSLNDPIKKGGQHERN